ncbi:MAG TPA: outer membrane beta-barrel protein [Verrucomicrobiae bacterium]|nr:outer membrane beta-barrel protein [Verrucomicrobiae bacterium]
MKRNGWTLGLLAAGVVSLPTVIHAEEKPTSVLTALGATTLSGYVNTSMIWDPGTSTASIPGRAFDGPASKQDGFNLDVVSLTLAKPVGEGDWGAGYLVQLWAGPDAVGFNTSAPNIAGAGGDFAVKQAYVDLHAPLGNGLDIKIGHFNYIGGYEQPDAGLNPNYSRSYAWTQEPASHTGVLFSYTVNPILSLMAGVANTVNNGIDWRAVRDNGIVSQTEKTYMAMASLTAPTNGFGFLGGSTLSATVVNGLNNASGDSGTTPTSGHITSLNVSATAPTPVAGLTVGASYDYTDGPDLPFSPGVNTESKYVNVTTLYIGYQATEKLKLYGRAEYTSASNGFWYAPSATSHNAELMELTGTLDYSLWKNVISRVEVRWDHSLTGDRPFGGTAADPGGEKNDVTLALNLIYNF